MQLDDLEVFSLLEVLESVRSEHLVRIEIC
jgi:hypothetical protein